MIRARLANLFLLLVLVGRALAGATAPTITTQPASQTVTLGAKATFSVVASGTAPLSYQWSRNGSAITGATSASYTTAATVAADSGASFTVKVSNSAGTKTSSAATLTLNRPPSITTQPANRSVVVGSTATFSVVATGTGTLAYQWSKNGTQISGATSATYTTLATVAGDSGASFTVKVSNSYGNVTSSAAILTVTAPVAPTITTQPTSKTVTLGSTAAFTVVASGTAPLTYQWFKNGSSITGATSASYTTPATVVADNGAAFTVKVTNAGGTATSNAATLTLNLPPTISIQPANQTVVVGGKATFSVVASGTGTLTYQWSKKGVAISGATAASYTTPSTVIGDNTATFTVKVTNSYGTVTSSTATLTVTAVPAPTITGFAPTSGIAGTSVTITGTNFTGATAVKFNGTNASSFTVGSATSITAVAPTGVTSGTISVTTPGGPATSSGSFTVVVAPTITSFTPTSGMTGTSVTITGMNFTGATAVKFNGTNASSFTVGSSTSITAMAPVGVTTGKISVTTVGGTATSSGSFTVAAAPSITGFMPTSGIAGTSVTITGANFTGATAVKFNGTNASSFTVGSSTSITAVAPTGVTTGTVSVTTPGGTAISSGSFTVVAAPAITSFTPASGIAGTSVTITGTNFTGATAVKFNGTNASSFTVESSTSIMAVAPTGVTTGKISVTTAGGTATSSSSFTVVAAPTITSFAPTSGMIGTTVTITGTSFTGATTVKFNGTNASSFTVGSPTSITAVAPIGVTSGTISVTTPGGTATSSGSFTVFDPADLGKVLLTPTQASVIGGGIASFTASVIGSTQGVTWRVEAGTWSYNKTTCTYTAAYRGTPLSEGVYTLTATSIEYPGQSATAPITVRPFIILNPDPAEVPVGGTLQFTADVFGQANPVLNWSATTGTIDQNGYYMAPASLGEDTVSVTLASDASKTASVSVRIHDDPSIITFTGNPTSITAGELVTLVWDARNSTSVSLSSDPDLGGLGAVAPSGSLSLKVNASTTFTLSAANATGTVQKTVEIQAVCPTVLQFKAESTLLSPGQTTRLYVEFTNGTGRVDPALGAVQSGTWVTIRPVGTTQYTLVVTNSLGAEQRASLVVGLITPGVFQQIETMPNVGFYSAVAPLLDGRVWVTGGQGSGRVTLSSTAFWDPATSAFTEGTILSVPRQGHRALLLPNGRVLLGGGYYSSLPDTSYGRIIGLQVVDPVLGIDRDDDSFESIDPAVTLLTSGKILLTGGTINVYNSAVTFTSSAYLYDPETSWTSSFVGDMAKGRSGHTSLLLPNGKVLILGGGNPVMELFDPDSGTFAPVGEATGPAVLMSDGRVLIFEESRAVIFDPQTNLLLPVPGPSGPDAYWPAYSVSNPVLLQDGRILMLDWMNGIFPIFDPIKGLWSALQEPLPPWTGGSVVPLNDGRALVVRDYPPCYVFDPQLPLTIDAGAALIQAGREFSLTARGQDVSGLQWVCRQAGATITSAGIFRSDTPGLYRVDLTNSRGDKAGVWITVVPSIEVYVTDSSYGLGSLIATSIHEPFVSTGKQKQFYVRVHRSQQVTWSMEEGSVAGSITEDGLYTAPAISGGPYHVIARSVEDPTRFERVAITVMAPIMVSPSSATLDPLESQPYSANDGCYWTVDHPNTVNSVGTVVAGTKSGTYAVTTHSTKYPGRTGSATLSVNDKPLVIIPKLLTLLAGGTIQFNAYSNGSQLARDTMNWSANGGSIDWNAIYVAPLTPGTYTVTVSSKTDATLTTQATVIVPAVSQGSISLRETSVSLNPAENYVFRAYIQGGSPDAVQWQATSGIIGTRAQGVNSDGSAWVDALYIPPSDQGTFRVRANLGFQQAEATVMVGVTPHLNSFTASPTTIRPGQPVTLSWSASDFSTLTLNPGKIDVAAKQSLQVFPSQDTLYVLTATNPGKAVSLSTWVKIGGAVTSVSVSPGTSNLYIGSQLGLTASIQGSGNFDPALSWTATGGTVTVALGGGASYTAPMTPGIYTVTATSVADSSKSGSAIVIVTAPPVTLSLSPVSATIYTGMALDLLANVQVGIGVDPRITWDATGGNVTAKDATSATYIAPATAGKYTVTAASVADPSKTASTTVTVQAPQVTMTINPASTSLVPGQGATFSASMQITGSIDASLTWSCTGGTIVPKGNYAFYAAPLALGSYVVTATSVANPEVTATAVVQVSPSISSGNYLNLCPGQATLRAGQRLFLSTDFVVADPDSGLDWVTDLGQVLPEPTGASAFYATTGSPGTATINVKGKTHADLGASIALTVNSANPQFATVPSSATLGMGQSFLIEVVDAQGNLIPNPSWAVQESGGGLITGAGQYVAPLQAGTYHVTATHPIDGSQTATTTITVLSGGGGDGTGTVPHPTDSGVTVSPSKTQIPAGTFQSLSALVRGLDDQSVTWVVENYPAAATIDSQGVFSANQAGTYRVFATSVADPTKNGSAVLMVVPSVSLIAGAPNMGALRGYSVTALKDGRVLVAGGQTGSTFTGTARIFDPATKVFTDLPSMLIPRSYHMATLLNDGRVLLAGGFGDFYNGCATLYGDVVAAEVFNPLSNQFEALPQPATGGSSACPGLMRRPHWMPSSAVLGNGQVLVIGNEFARTQMVFPTPTPYSEVQRYLLSDLFDPISNIFDVSNWDAGTNDWALTTNCFEARAQSAMVTMDDGSALITGGLRRPVNIGSPCNYQGGIFNEAWRFTPSGGRTALSSMVSPRERHTMTKLPNGKVLIVGGNTSLTFQVSPPAPDYDPQEHYLSTAMAEIYDPATGSFTATGSMSVARSTHAAILLPTGKVMIVGGKTENGDGTFSWPTTIEIYDPDTESMTISDDLGYGLEEPKLAIQSDGNVFITGTVQGVPAASLSLMAINKGEGSFSIVRNSLPMLGSLLWAQAQVDNHLKVTVHYQKPMPQVDGLHFLPQIKIGTSITVPLANCRVGLIGADGKELLAPYRTDPYRTDKHGVLDIRMPEPNATAWMAIPAKNRTLAIYPEYTEPAEADGSTLSLQVADAQGSSAGFIQKLIPTFRAGGTGDNADATIKIDSSQVASCYNVLNTVSAIWSGYNTKLKEDPALSAALLPPLTFPITYDKDGIVSGKISHFSETEIYVTGGFNTSSAAPDGYDDPVLIHELGHLSDFMSSGGIRVSPGERHDPAHFSYDSNLAFAEGWANAFQSVFRQSVPGYAISPVLSCSYSFWDTDGFGKYYLNMPLRPDSLPNISATGGAYGPYNEWSVFSFLWQIYNDPAVLNKNPKAFMAAKMKMTSVSLDFLDIFTFKQALLALTNPDGTSMLSDVGKARVETLWGACTFPSTSTTLPMPYTRALPVTLSTVVDGQTLTPTQFGNRYQSIGYYVFTPALGGDYTVALTPSVPLPAGVTFLVESKPIGGGGGYTPSDSTGNPFTVTGCVASNPHLIRVRLKVVTTSEPVNPSAITFSLTVQPPAAPAP